jgi:hypothetical protein
MTDHIADTDSLLTIYLRDHHAAGAAGVELAWRIAKENADWTHADALTVIATEIESDRATLSEILLSLGTGPSPVKAVLATAIERLSHLKLNGRTTGYSPLSRVLELETLYAGIVGKRALWRTLAKAKSTRPQLGPYDFAALEARADDQLARVEAIRRDAMALAFDVLVRSAA